VALFTGSIPLTSTTSEHISLEDHDAKAPYARPILMTTTMFHGLSFVYCYMRYVSYQQTGFVLGALGYGIMATVGIWGVVFGDTKARLSKRTGADKRTSGWPFKNTQAYDKKKDRKMG
jgi:glutathione S-transferase